MHPLPRSHSAVDCLWCDATRIKTWSEAVKVIAMSTSVQELLDAIEQETEPIDKLSSASKEVLMTILLDAFNDRIPIENAGYLALRELCNRGGVPVELLLLAHSLAQWVSIATVEELDGSFLERARELEPDNHQVLYALLEKRPNVEGDSNQKAFEQRIVNHILNLYPEEPIGIEASAILASSDESLPLDFINRLPNPLEGIDFTQLLKAMR